MPFDYGTPEPGSPPPSGGGVTGGGDFWSGVAGAIPFVGGILSNAMNANATEIANRHQRAWAEQMYGIQRKDALSDWNMQNAYNSPIEQVNRLRAANLNPALMYKGGGDTGGGSVVRASSAGSYSPSAPRFDFGQSINALSAMYDLKVKQAQVDNLHVNNQLLQDQHLINKYNLNTGMPALSNLRNAQEFSAYGSGSYAYKQTENLNQLMPLNVDFMKARIGYENQLTQFSKDEDVRRIAMNEKNVLLAAQRYLLLKAQTANTEAEKDNILARLDYIKQDTNFRKLATDLEQKNIQWYGTRIGMSAFSTLIGGAAKVF